MFELFASLTVLFWVGVLTIPVFIFLSESEAGYLGLAVAAAVLISLQIWTDVKFFSALMEAPWKALGIAVIYLIGGILWGVAKWYFFASEAASFYRGLPDNEKRRHGSHHPRYRSLPLTVSEHKQRIVTWMTLWPWSALWTLLSDPLVKFYNFVYDRIAKSLQAISDRLFADIPPPPPVERKSTRPNEKWERAEVIE